MPQFVYCFNGLPLTVGCSKSAKSRAQFYRFLTSIRGMIKWVTPLGRVFKIYDFFSMVLMMF